MTNKRTLGKKADPQHGSEGNNDPASSTENEMRTDQSGKTDDQRTGTDHTTLGNDQGSADKQRGQEDERYTTRLKSKDNKPRSSLWGYKDWTPSNDDQAPEDPRDKDRDPDRAHSDGPGRSPSNSASKTENDEHESVP